MKNTTHFRKLFSVLLIGLIIIAISTGCNHNSNDEGDSNSSQTSVASKSNALTKEDVDTAQKQLSIILEQLLACAFTMKEPIEDASKLSPEVIHNFVIATSFWKTDNNPYDQKHLPIKDITYEETNRDGNNYTANYRLIPLQTAQQIAYEVFGVKDFTYKEGFYHEKLDGYAIPEVGLNAFYAYKNLNMSINGSNITASCDLINRSGEYGSEHYGHFQFYFQITKEDNHTFIRFLKSEKTQ